MIRAIVRQDGSVLLGPDARQLRLLDAPMAALSVVSIDDANRLLVAWEHGLGPVNRPFSQRAYALEIDGEPVSVAVSASLVSAHVSGQIDGADVRYERQQVVELARLASSPDARWATRPMLRLWREVAARRWPDWPVIAAVSYSHNRDGTGQLYRWDGWQRINDNCGSSGGGAWSRQRYAGEPVYGRKSLWLYRFEAHDD